MEIRGDGTIGAVSEAGAAERGRNVIDVQGKLIMPALINCHTHLYSTLARGISLTGKRPRNFPEILEKAVVAARLALSNPDDIYYSAAGRAHRFGEVRGRAL